MLCCAGGGRLKSAFLLRLFAFRTAVRCMAVRRCRAAQRFIAGPKTEFTIMLTFRRALDGAAVVVARPCFAVQCGDPLDLGADKRGHRTPQCRGVRCVAGSAVAGGM